ncbi:uncharacterized protein LOC110985724 [Acanthaster planci]|uniref:Uncharacterized protein LOC110985724 n=1 Tax=Acanthaster planci TaxID=133434 RepID=A0A8B7ZAG1_ACAPL|nr:uncharacterized protein LOC110985724 [Acanthaster planci]
MGLGKTFPVISAIILQFTFIAVEAYTCFVGQELQRDASTQTLLYRWVLTGQSPLDPCDCAAFRLGGVNTAVSGSCVRAFNLSELSKTTEEIRRALGCPRGEPQRTFFTGPTDNGGAEVLFPLGKFASPLRTTFELSMDDKTDIPRVYLAEFPQITVTERPPYMIEFRATEMVIHKLQSGVPGVTFAGYYGAIQTKAIPEELGTRQFTVTCEYEPLPIPEVEIEVVFVKESGLRYTMEAVDTLAKEVHYVGIFSSARAEWKFLNP